jgi:hypothetical protein
MKKLPSMLVLWLILAAGVFGLQPHEARSDESVGQERMAYYRLSLLRSLSKPGAGFQEYRDALIQAREYVGLLRDGSSGKVALLRKAMSYYEKAYAVWTLQTDSEFPVDSLRTDEPAGAEILEQCPDIPRFHYKERDQIYVQDAVSCMWRKAADLLDKAPTDQH